jgi:hypothetical protein
MKTRGDNSSAKNGFNGRTNISILFFLFEMERLSERENKR